MGKAAEAEIFAPLPEYTTTERGGFLWKKHLAAVFSKNGTDRTTQAEVTRIWAALINQAEKASTILARENA